MAIFRNLFAGIGCLTMVLVLGVAGWMYRAEIADWIRSRNEIVMTEPSPELAARAAEKLEAIAGGAGPEEVRISELELQSYVQFHLAEQLPAGVYDPAVDLRDSTAAMSAELRLDELAGGVPDGVRRFLGDSARVLTELYPVVEAPGQGRVTVISLQAGLVPVPPLLIPTVLEQVGLSSGGSRAVVFAIPDDVRSIRIEQEEVVLVRERQRR